MNPSSKALAAAVLTAVTALALTPDAAGQRRRTRDIGLQHFTFTMERCKAKALGGSTARYGVFLPKDYDAEKNAQKTYPFAIWLHGMRERLHTFRDSGGKIFDGLRTDKVIPDMILITPGVSSMPLYMNGSRRGEEEDLILKDIWSDASKKYRLAKERHKHAIMGVSMGALGAMKIALRHPDKFGSVAVHSGPVLPADPKEMSGRFKRYGEFMGIESVFGNPIDPQKWAKEVPMAMITTQKPARFQGLRIYFDAGTNDRYAFGPPNQEFSQELKKRGIRHTFNYIQGGGHSWSSGTIQRQMKVSFGFVAKGFAKAPKVTPSKKGKPKKAPTRKGKTR